MAGKSNTKKKKSDIQSVRNESAEANRHWNWDAIMGILMGAFFFIGIYIGISIQGPGFNGLIESTICIAISLIIGFIWCIIHLVIKIVIFIKGLSNQKEIKKSKKTKKKTNH